MNIITIETTRSMESLKKHYGLLHNKTGIYFLHYREELVYIGKAMNLYYRLQSHLENTTYQIHLDKNKISMIKFIYCKPEQEDDFELALIQKFKPKLNVKDNETNFVPIDFYCSYCGRRHEKWNDNPCTRIQLLERVRKMNEMKMDSK